MGSFTYRVRRFHYLEKTVEIVQHSSGARIVYGPREGGASPRAELGGRVRALRVKATRWSPAGVVL